jgi:putative transposase
MVSPQAKREAAFWLMAVHGVSQRRACRALKLCLATARYRSKKGDGGFIRQRLRSLAEERPRFGYRRLHVLLRREGLAVNHKRVYRLYRADGLQVRRRKRKRVALGRRIEIIQPTAPNQRWSMDFMSDQLADGRRFRTLNIVDDFTRESLAIEAGTSLPGTIVVRTLERVRSERGEPKTIVIDNGPEFTGRTLDAWAHARGVRLSFIRPGKPMENAYIESFNGKFRDECLNQQWFINMQDARRAIEDWRQDYNNERPHSALGNQTPTEYRWTFTMKTGLKTDSRPNLGAS